MKITVMNKRKAEMMARDGDYFMIHKGSQIVVSDIQGWSGETMTPDDIFKTKNLLMDMSEDECVLISRPQA